jgi:hypothetical protein
LPSPRGRHKKYLKTNRQGFTPTNISQRWEKTAKISTVVDDKSAICTPYSSSARRKNSENGDNSPVMRKEKNITSSPLFLPT